MWESILEVMLETIIRKRLLLIAIVVGGLIAVAWMTGL